MVGSSNKVGVLLTNIKFNICTFLGTSLLLMICGIFQHGMPFNLLSQKVITLAGL
jgi:hypothetical protein